MKYTHLIRNLFYCFRNLKPVFLVLVIFSLLTLSSCSLAGDVTPPPVFEPSLPAETSEPVVKPSATVLPALTQTAVENEQVTSTPVEAAAEPAAEGEKQTFQINGFLEGQVDLSQAEGLQVDLMGYEGMQLYSTTPAEVDSDGNFSFTNVEWRSGLIYFVSVEYKSMLFTSDMLLTEDVPAGSAVDLAVEIYETGSDLSGLIIDRAHVFINFLDAQTIQVVLYAIVSNTSDLLVTPLEDGSPALVFSLPQGAQNLQFESGSIGDRYVQTENGFGDLSMIQPGSQVYEILYAYSLPYDRKITVPVEFPLPVTSLIVAVPADGLKLSAESLSDEGQRVIDNQTVQLFSGTSLAANTPLDLSFSGNPGQASAAETGFNAELIFGLLILVLVLAAAGFWFWKNKKKKLPQPEIEASIEKEEPNHEDLLDEILELDDLYEAGSLSAEEYHLKRRELKLQLKKLKEGLEED